MIRLGPIAIGLAALLPSCIAGGHCVEGVSLIFLCDKGVTVTKGAKDIPATCVYNFDQKSACTSEQESNEMLQFEWDETTHSYVSVCIPKCKDWHAEDAICYETCEAAAGQQGVNCIRGHGNQWLLDDDSQTSCE